MIALLNAAIADEVAYLEQFDVLDDIDSQEQAQDFIATAATVNTSDKPRKPRGIECKTRVQFNN